LRRTESAPGKEPSARAHL